MQRLQALAFIVGAPRGLPVDGDQVVTIGPQRCDPALETPPKEPRIDAVHEIAQPALAGNAEVKFREAAQKGEMALAPGGDLIEIVTRT